LRTYELRCEQHFQNDVARTFSFFEDPSNLSRITPSWLNFVITTQDLEMSRGAEIDYTIAWMGIPLKWRTLIDEYDPPRGFVDLQLKGPYKLWRHVHSFEAVAGGTLVRDVVRYALPFGPAGRIAHAFLVRHQLLEIFSYRQQTLATILGESAYQPSAPTIRAV
jgi:ligand-binding SRPBCC domain-containing protein